ncbi:MAG: hypothetical protein U9R77_04660 [Pseudomonadota bacterium]|uniref:hypothetical protein n=1 Tax=Sphingobium naphthae TaxID=1886786 RepID=UPI002B0AEFDA|nr:hypothetical protein [Pseudomonadota bacterium]
MRAALARRVEARAAAVRARIAGALEAEGVTTQVAGETVRLTAPGLGARWWRELALREAGRNGR